MMTSSGIFASIASMTASFVKAGGTNAMEGSAPVTAIASATVANTGSSTGRPFLSVWEREGFFGGVGDGRTCLACVDAARDLRARREHPRRVLGAFATGDALDDDLGVLVEEDRHVFGPCP